MEIGKAIRIVRQAKGIALGDLARQAGISAAFLSLVEGGKRQPSLDVLDRLSRVLGVPKDTLLLLAQGKRGTLATDDERTARLVGLLERLKRAEEALEKELREGDTQDATGGRDYRTSG